MGLHPFNELTGFGPGHGRTFLRPVGTTPAGRQYYLSQKSIFCCHAVTRVMMPLTENKYYNTILTKSKIFVIAIITNGPTVQTPLRCLWTVKTPLQCLWAIKTPL